MPATHKLKWQKLDKMYGNSKLFWNYLIVRFPSPHGDPLTDMFKVPIHAYS